MSLPRKSSRKIIVEGQQYRWMVIPSYEYHTAIKIHLDAKDPGQQLQVTLNGTFVITPASVAFLIQYYRERGWHPEEGGLHIIGPERSRKAVLAFQAHQKEKE